MWMEFPFPDDIVSIHAPVRGATNGKDNPTIATMFQSTHP